MSKSMAFYKKRQQKVNGLWYPQSITVGRISMDRLVERLAQISTVSKSDVQAVMGDLASVLADYMSLGYTVEIEGLGTFYYTAVTNKQGVPTADEVSPEQITGVRIRFLPETSRSSDNKTVTRALSNVEITWEEYGSKDKKNTTSGGDDGDDDLPLG